MLKKLLFLLLSPLLNFAQPAQPGVYQKPWPIFPLNPASYVFDLAGADSLSVVTAIAYTTTGLRMRPDLQPTVNRLSPGRAVLTYANPSALPGLSQVRVSAGSLVRLLLDVNSSVRNTTAPSSNTLTFSGGSSPPAPVTVTSLWQDLMALLL